MPDILLCVLLSVCLILMFGTLISIEKTPLTKTVIIFLLALLVYGGIWWLVHASTDNWPPVSVNYYPIETIKFANQSTEQFYDDGHRKSVTQKFGQLFGPGARVKVVEYSSWHDGIFFVTVDPIKITVVGAGEE
jgi:hypothetical protein